VVQALDTFGKSRTLSSPRLAVVNNQEASILIGTSIPYTTSSVTTPSSGPTTSSESVSFIDTGVKLHVTPVIHQDGYVTMKIKPEISNEKPKSFTASDGTVIPIVDTSEVQTTVRVKDGVTIIIGGLMKDEWSIIRIKSLSWEIFPGSARLLVMNSANMQKNRDRYLPDPRISSTEMCMLTLTNIWIRLRLLKVKRRIRSLAQR